MSSGWKERADELLRRIAELEQHLKDEANVRGWYRAYVELELEEARQEYSELEWT